eukprot:jgi/Bigna1/84761/fgenesh1_pg.317_\
MKKKGNIWELILLLLLLLLLMLMMLIIDIVIVGVVFYISLIFIVQTLMKPVAAQSIMGNESARVEAVAAAVVTMDIDTKKIVTRKEILNQTSSPIREEKETELKDRTTTTTTELRQPTCFCSSPAT